MVGQHSTHLTSQVLRQIVHPLVEEAKPLDIA
jgi:hypothetical protein